MSQDNSKS